MKARRYELWDSESANLAGSYPLELAALHDVAAYVDQYGEDVARSLCLLELCGPTGGRCIAAGALLITKARAVANRRRASAEPVRAPAAHRRARGAPRPSVPESRAP